LHKRIVYHYPEKNNTKTLEKGTKVNDRKDKTTPKKMCSTLFKTTIDTSRQM
jgi:hypothetical protein